ncbi:tetratricopeptide repeat protein [Robertkochia marina]|uniref:Tetratricopeptide repeat protein n=1 Tax=Robertkochia marina TaxID=1227945 RepID=A0A4S3M1Q7_9FLAO|nr:tetratricopeptide repeat protein [Robertkochia marina]THD69044.1 tetratricopeptide repeat protein [Robertkochia marina]TRZ44867.1 hypothetical protein D3A96_07535 [Robertkochia marina]
MRVLLFFFGFILFFTKASAQQQNTTLADSLFQAKNYTRAINAYAGINSLEARYQIAKAYVELGNYQKAITQLEYLSESYPEQPQVIADLGGLLFRTRQFERSAEVYGELIEIDSLNPDPRYRLGRTYGELKKDSLAQLQFQKAFELDSTHLKSCIELGEFYLKRRQFEKAHQYAEKGLALAPDHAELLNIKALAWFNDYQFELAKPYFEKLVELNYREDFLLLRLARCYEKTWEKDKAVRVYKFIVAADPGNADAYYELGALYRDKNQLDSAQYFFNEAYLDKKPDLSRELVALASIHREKGELGKALELYKQAHEEAPESMHIYFNVCELAGKYYKDSARVRPYLENFRKLYAEEKYAYIYMDKIEGYLRELEE